MTGNVGNTDSNQKLQELLLDGVPKTAPRKATGTAAPGVSGDGTGSVGATPPAAPANFHGANSQSLTVSLAPGLPAPPDAETLSASTARFAVAANGGPTAGPVTDFVEMALSPLDAIRALFKAAMLANDHQRDAALQTRKDAIEDGRSKQLLAASENRKAADDIDSKAGQQLFFTCCSAVSTVCAAKSTDTGNAGAWKGIQIFSEGMANLTNSDKEANIKRSDATVALAQADNDEEKSRVADANELERRLTEAFAQILNALRDIGESHAKTVAIA